MANRTAWVAGNGVGLAWATAPLINSSDMVSLAAGSSVLSTVGDITNGTALDQFMDISVRLACASSTITAGMNFALFLYALLDDGTTYGDGKLTAGSQAALTPAFPPVAIIPLFVGASQTALTGYAQGVVIPPGSLRFAIQNNSVGLSAGTQTVKYRSYNIQLNN